MAAATPAAQDDGLAPSTPAGPATVSPEERARIDGWLDRVADREEADAALLEHGAVGAYCLRRSSGAVSALCVLLSAGGDIGHFRLSRGPTGGIQLVDGAHELPECPDVYAAVAAARVAGTALLGVELGECLDDPDGAGSRV